MTAEGNLKRLGIILPAPPAAVGQYVPWIRTGSMVITSGQLPWESGVMKYPGRLGRNLTTHDGYAAARIAATNAIAQRQTYWPRCSNSAESTLAPHSASVTCL